MTTLDSGIIDLTLYAVPKAFKGQYTIWQRNALISWTRLEPRPHIVIVGDEAGIGEFAAEFDLEHVPEVRRNEKGTPKLGGVFEIMGQAKTEHVGLINADIVVFNSLVLAWQAVHMRLDRYLMVGRRITCPMGPIDFSRKTWAQDALAMATGHQLDTPGAIDYFIFKKGVYDRIPDLTLGRTAWDNWLVGNVDGAVVNATPCVVVLHPQHGYGATGNGAKSEIFSGQEAQENRALCSGDRLHSVNHATWYVDLGYAVRQKGGRGYQRTRDDQVLRSVPAQMEPPPPEPPRPPANQTPPPPKDPAIAQRRGYRRPRVDREGRPMMPTSHRRKGAKPKIHDPGVGGLRSM